MLIIDILGSSGSGKTAVAEELCALLREDGVISPSHHEDHYGTTEVPWLLRRSHLLKRPGLVPRAVSLSAIRPDSWSRFRAFQSHLGSLAERSRKVETARAVGSHAVVFPQGLIYRLQKDIYRANQLLPIDLRSNMAVLLSAPPHERAARRIRREKTVTPVAGASRLTAAQDTFSVLRSGYSFSDASKLLEEWNARNCCPPLERDTLVRIVVDHESLAESQRAVQAGRCAVGAAREASLSQAFEAVGVVVLRIKNDDSVPLSEVSARIRDEVSRILG